MTRFIKITIIVVLCIFAGNRLAKVFEIAGELSIIANNTAAFKEKQYRFLDDQAMKAARTVIRTTEILEKLRFQKED